MADLTNIEWADSTFNPWEGCQKVSPACDHCYAENRNARFGGGVAPNWGPRAPRRRTSPQNWNKPRRWQKDAAAFFAEHGRRRRVFCASLADVFDNAVPVEWRYELWALIYNTPDLIWMLLTKRPQNIAGMLPDYPVWEEIKGRIWLGTTVEDQKRFDLNAWRLTQYDCAERFLSCEPLLGPVDASPWLGRDKISWVIAGGESGPHARPSHPDWFRSLRDQARTARVPFLHKQNGEYQQVDDEAAPKTFGDPECSKYRVVSSCGLLFDLSLGSAFSAPFFHNYDLFPNCFPNGPDGRSICNLATMKKVGKKAAGRTLDGRTHDGFPEGHQ